MGLFDWLFKKSETKPSANWKTGDRVLAKWFDSFFYPGKVGQVTNQSCEIYFDDGDVAWVHPKHIITPDISVGSVVFSRIRGGPQYFPGRVSDQKGESIYVRYDHGEEEWTSISFVRVERPIVDVGNEALAPGQPPPGKPNVDLGDPIDQGTWRVGDRVLARWFDFYWYPGTILGIGSKGVHILYDFGMQRVVPEFAIMTLLVEEGEQIDIRPKNITDPLKNFIPATVTRVSGETMDVELEDGTFERNIRVTRARFWRCPFGVSAEHFDEGDRVLAFDADECVYPAEIVSALDDRITVQYLDGPERMLTPELIRKFEIKEGMRIECRWKGAPNYFPGVLAKIDGERIFVKYDDGDEEWTSIRLFRLPKATANA